MIIRKKLRRIMRTKLVFLTAIFVFLYTLSIASDSFKSNLSFPQRAHPFHVGLVEVQIDSNQLELAVRVFTDDLEMMLSERFRKEVDLTLGDSAINFWMLHAMLREDVRLQADSQAIDLHYLGCEGEEDALWLYLEQDLGKKEIKNWALKLTLLTQLFPEQRFVVRIHQNGHNKTQLLTGPDFLIQWSGVDL